MSNAVNIAEFIELNPHVPVIAEARLKGYGVAVWALIGHLPAVKAIWRLLPEIMAYP